jgi:hypothetical protein
MPRIIFNEPSGVRHEIEAPVGITLMEAAVQNGVQGIVAMSRAKRWRRACWSAHGSRSATAA